MTDVFSISPAVPQGEGVLTHRVSSPWQAGQTAIHVLRPDRGESGAVPRALYLLPVEPHEGRQCGDPLAEIREHDLHNRYQLTCIQPTFSHAPWYADHPANPQIRQETYLLRAVVPFVDHAYFNASAPPVRVLAGFSKSGWGALSLLLRHPDLFEKAAAFDAPLAWETPNRYGMGEVFATQETMDQYCIGPLLQRTAATLAGSTRLAIYGFSEFRGHHQFLHHRLLKLGIPHVYEDGPRRAHRWDSGWLPDAVRFLAASET